MASESSNDGLENNHIEVQNPQMIDNNVDSAIANPVEDQNHDQTPQNETDEIPYTSQPQTTPQLRFDQVYKKV